MDRLSLQVEPFSAMRPEMEPIIAQHWKEAALNQDVIKLAPDWERYERIEAENAVHVVTVRDQGKLVGYYIAVVWPHLHYRNDLMALTDVYFILPEYRRASTGLKLFRFVEKTLRERGVK